MAEPRKRNVDAVLISVLSVLERDINEWVVEESDSDSRSDERWSDSEDSGSSVGDNEKIRHLLSQLCARPNLYSVKWVSKFDKCIGTCEFISTAKCKCNYEFCIVK